MKILIFGKNGQVGRELCRALAPLGKLVALSRDSADYCGDLTNTDGIAETIRAAAPNIIVNAAAYTAVDKAESEKDLAQQINAVAPGIMAREAAAVSAMLVHYSTDYVFDGSSDKPWREKDKPAPLNIYGQTKLDGEKVIQDSNCRHLIFRTSWVYAAEGNNFIKTMLRLGKEREALSVVDDQIGAPTGATLIADATAQAMRIATDNPSIDGLYHLTASGETSWYAYARSIFDCAGNNGTPLKIRADGITPILSQAYPTPAKRPLNSRLDTGKFRQTFGMALPDWKIGVMEVIKALS